MDILAVDLHPALEVALGLNMLPGRLEIIALVGSIISGDPDGKMEKFMLECLNPLELSTMIRDEAGANHP